MKVLGRLIIYALFLAPLLLTNSADASNSGHRVYGGFGQPSSEGGSNTLFGLGTDNGVGPSDDDLATFIGFHAGFGNVSGNSNTFVGYEAGLVNSFGSNNTFVGRSAG